MLRTHHFSFAISLSLMLALPACSKTQTGSNEPGSGEDSQTALETSKRKAAAETLTELANQDLKKGRYAAAGERAENALKSDPNNAEAYAVIGAARWRAGDYQESTKAYKEALEIDANNFGAILGLARNLQASGDHEKALELVDKLVAQDKTQVDPLMYQFQSYYALSDADKGVETLELIFKYLGGDDPLLPVIQAQAAFFRPLAGKGPLIQVEGNQASSDAGLDLNQGLKHIGGIVGDQFTRIVIFEVRDEARISKELAQSLGLPSLGKVKPIGTEEETDVVLIPEVKFNGDLVIKNIPAIVEDLSAYASIGEQPGLVFGRQVLQKLGAITFDFPQSSSELVREKPTATPAEAKEAPYLLIDMRALLVPVTSVVLDEAADNFYAWFGGVFYKSAIAVSRKAFLKSKHLPRELEPLDDPEQGLKMFFADQVRIGELKLQGVGGLVMTNNPPSAELGQLVAGTGFEISGYINPTVLRNLKITYAVSSGKLLLTPLAQKS